jgi:hypothetical protein
VLEDLIDTAKNKGDAAIGKTYHDTNQTDADIISTNTNSLASKGLFVSDMHRSIAKSFHDWLNRTWVDHDVIVKNILKENIQTFRLVSVAYGTRPLPYYAMSPLHIANVGLWDGIKASWNPSDQYSGTLKTHLTIILTDDEKKKISHYLSVI